MQYIEGADRAQITLFPEALDDYISDDNPARVIDIFVEQLDMPALGFAELAETGRPPYSPKLLMKLYIYGYFNKIRSSRRLETETKRNIELMWLMGKLSPDHKTISRFRSSNGAAIKKVFRSFVRLCDRCGLYGKELFSIDGSKFTAVNSKERNFNAQKLSERIANIEKKISAYLSELDENDADERDNMDASKISAVLKELAERKAFYAELLLDLDKTEQTQVSLTDSDSRRISSSNGNTLIGYNVQTAVDGKNGLIAEFDVGNSSPDMGHLYGVSSKTKATLEITHTIDIVADKGYNSANDMAKCYSDGIVPNVIMDIESFDICVEASEPTDKPTEHSNGRCVYLAERNICICPMGETLYPSYYRDSRRYVSFNNRKACLACKCKCTTTAFKQFEVYMPKSRFSKDYDIDGLCVKQVRITPDKKLTKLRKLLSEHPFGVVKRCMDAGYLLTRGFEKVESEFSLAFMVFNLKRAITLLGAKGLIEQMQTM